MKPMAQVMAAMVVAAGLGAVRPAHAGFVGDLVLEPDGCTASGQCRLGADFGFVDGAGYGWQAAMGMLTDGATIPPWARPFVGEPFDKAFIKAAVIHDHYCKRYVRPWRATHKVFHEALRASGVPAGKAGIMYFAVLVGGPKWVKLIKGKPCPVGMGCINQFDVTATVSGGQIGLDSGGELILGRSDAFHSASFENTLAENLPALLAQGDALTAEKVEALAAEAMAGDFFFTSPEEVGTVIGVTTSFE